MKPGLQSLYLFKGTITLNSALHVGGGTMNTTNTDSTVVRTPEGIPFIPGSSFKGVFRSTVEKLAGVIPNLEVCSLAGGKDCFHRKFMEKTANGNNRYNVLNDQINEKVKNEPPEAGTTRAERHEELLFNAVIKEICETCRLFGNGFTASKIFFSDLYLLDWAGVTQVRDGVVIDRDSEKAVEGLKYDFEVVPAGAVFDFEIRLENPRDPEDLGLTCLGLNEFQSGLSGLGGNRSRGLGNCKMHLEQVYSVDLQDGEQLKRYLLHTELDEKMNKKDDIPGFLQQAITPLISQS